MNEEFLKEVQKDVKHVFSGPEGESVLEFLGNMCGQYKTTIVPGSEQLTNVNEGRRQVFLTIQTFLDNKSEDLMALYEMLEGK